MLYLGTLLVAISLRARVLRLEKMKMEKGNGKWQQNELDAGMGWLYRARIMTGKPPEEFARFISAQSRTYSQVLRELTAGRKESHWMWFIFPQLRGLGHTRLMRTRCVSWKSEVS